MRAGIELRPHIEASFDRPHVTIDFAGFSGETLRDALAEALDKVHVGRLAPETIAVRVLISDMAVPGYASHPAKGEKFQVAGAGVVITGMDEMANALMEGISR